MLPGLLPHCCPAFNRVGQCRECFWDSRSSPHSRAINRFRGRDQAAKPKRNCDDQSPGAAGPRPGHSRPQRQSGK
jgi:hypothetical protein